MKLLIGIVFVLLAAFWTGAAWLGAQALQWAGHVIASGQATQIGDVVGSWPIPAWITAWVDPTAIHAALDAMVGTLESLQQAVPFIGNAMSWLVPLVWVGWAIGFVLLLVVTAIALFAVRRFGARPPSAGGPGVPRPLSS